ncbi:Arrestin domain-containing protein 3 [Branchiostoma belcheri]|nr:Arrestin domain-containing protein 3 [Branchiostoma belcheri]
MGRLKLFEIALDGDKAVYEPTEVVSGHVVLELRGEMRLRSLKVDIRGLAKVHWTESRGMGTETGSYTQHFTDELEYFHMEETLLGNGTDSESEAEDDQPLLTAGRHQFSFSFQLPDERLPTSFEGKHGSVRYWLKAEIDRPWTLPSKVKRDFTIIDHIDINDTYHLTPTGGSREKTLCCWLCTSGPVSLSARTDRRGYCPGESIAISAEFENHSSRRMIPKAALYQTQCYRAGGKTRTVRENVAHMKGEALSAGDTVQCFLDIPGGMNLILHLPIVIGTVPLSRQPYPIHLYPMAGISTPFADAPPSYDECMAGLPSPDIPVAAPPGRVTLNPGEPPPNYSQVNHVSTFQGGSCILRKSRSASAGLDMEVEVETVVGTAHMYALEK